MKNFRPAFFLFSFLFLSAPVFAAEVGDNCEVDIVSSVPADQDWNQVYMVKGDDGNTWQRAILPPNLKSIELEELGTFTVKITAQPNADVQIFFFVPQNNENGGILKPTNSNCLYAGVADERGDLSLEISARMLWNSLGQELALDAFTKLEKSWSQAVPEDTNENFYIGTALPMSKAVVMIAEEKEEKKRPSKTVDCGTESSFFGSNSLETGVELDPADIDDQYITYANVDDKPVLVARITGLHTFYTGTETAEAYDQTDLLPLSMSAITMETIKRYLLGNPYVTKDILNGISEISASKLEKALSGTGDISQMINAIKDALTNTDRIDALSVLKDLIIAERGPSNEQSERCNECEGFPMEPLIENDSFWEGLLPAVSDDATWATDFIKIMTFWTGGVTKNDGLIEDDDVLGWNYLETYSGYDTHIDCGSRKMVYTNGVSPRLLLGTTDPVTLEPDFTDIILHSSNLTFSSGESWNLPEGEKEEVYYTYRKKSPIEYSSIADICVNKDTLPDLSQDLQKTFALTDDEVRLIIKELSGRMTSDPQGYTSLSLADPKDIAKRFAWKGNGGSLDIAQLFFERRPTSCSGYSLDTLSLLDPFSSERDGFEVGMVE